MSSTHASLIANLALDAAALGFEDADIRFAVMMASHVTHPDLIRDYFEREFPREWPSKEERESHDGAPSATSATDADAKKAAKKAAKRRRYRANRAAAKKAAAEGKTLYDYSPSEAAAMEQESPAVDDDAEAGRLISALFKLAVAELDDDEESEASEEEAAPAAAPLPDVQKLSYKDATVQSSVVRLKRGGVMEVRRDQLTGSNIPDRKTWASAEAWRASLPNPNVTFDEDGCYTAIQEAETRQSAADRMRAAFAKELKELGIVEKTIRGTVYYYDPEDQGVWEKVPGLNDMGDYVGTYDAVSDSIKKESVDDCSCGHCHA
jgi:hypothetical protein